MAVERKTLAPAMVASQLQEIFARLLERAAVDPDVHFADLGGDSIQTLSLLLEVEERFGLALTPAEFAGQGSVAALAALIAGGRKARRRLALIQRGDGSAPLFLAHALVGATAYAGWLAELLGPRQTLVLMQWRAPEPGQPVTLEAHAAAYVEAIRREQPKGPYRLAGHSFGALLAYEVARQIEAAGGDVGFLGLFDRGPLLHAREFGSARRPVESQRTADLCDHMRAAYVPRHYPGDAWLFRAGVAATDQLCDPTSGWGDLVRGRLRQVEAAGTHTGMMSREVLRGWVGALRAALDDAAMSAPAVGRQEAMRIWCDRPEVVAATAARIAGRAGEREAEIAAYRAAIAAAPRQPYWVWRNLAEALEEAGDVDGAALSLEQAVASEAVPIGACAALWQLLQRHGRPGAGSWLDRAFAFDQDDVPTQLALAELDLARGAEAEAERRLRRVLELCPIHEPAARQLQRCLQGQGRLADALLVARRVASLLPGEVKPLLEVARLAGAIGEAAEKKAALRAVLAIRPGHPEAERSLRD